MKDFEVISTLKTPDDQYIKEVVVLQFILLMKDDEKCKLRIPYVRKVNKEGGLFWSPISAGVNLQGEKKYLHHKFDSEFLKDDIENFLNNRSWETRVNPTHSPSVKDDLPF